MRIIDVNAALGAPTKSPRGLDEAALYRQMDTFAIDAALVYHAEFLRSPWTGNSKILEIAAASGGRVKPCVGLNPSVLDDCLPGEGTIADKLRASRVPAARVFPDDNGYLFDKFYASELLALSDDMRLPLIIDCACDKTFLAALPDAAEAYPRAPLILLRFGLNHSRYIFPLLKGRKNVYFDMSTMLDVGQIEEIVARFGSERLLFGSGLPYYEPSGALGLLMYAEISRADRENIAHANFERLEAEIRYGI